MSKQHWVCEVCGISGAVEHGDDAGVMEVINALENQHDRLAKLYAPHCRFDIHKVRVHNPELMDQYAWNRSVAEIQQARQRS